MGLFSKEPRVSADSAEKLAAFDLLQTTWDRSPSAVVAHFLSTAPDPLRTLAETLALLVNEGVLTPHALSALGIDTGELATIAEHLADAEPGESLRYAAAVNEAMAAYESQVDEILAAAGVTLDPSARTSFRVAVAKFAYENSVPDLKIAYRLMRAEGLDPLVVPPDTRPGYL
jgi:hypothetical protein